jgi:predicted transcriptional regulator of viral defense system
VDHVIATVAAQQYGVVSRAQLRAIGLSDTAIGKRASAGRLHRVHHGVYAVGHRALPAGGAWMAATLACGPGAVLSHTSAAALWEIAPEDPLALHVTVPTAGGRRRPGLVIHRDPSFERAAAATPLARAGYRTLRFSHQQVTDDASAVAATVAAALRYPNSVS